MPIAARDLYRDGYGEMNVKLLSLIKVAFDNNKEIAQSALITTFCEFMLIPGYLLLNNIKWEQIDDYTVRGILVDNEIEVSGMFYFDKDDYLHILKHSTDILQSAKTTIRKLSLR